MGKVLVSVRIRRGDGFGLIRKGDECFCPIGRGEFSKPKPRGRGSFGGKTAQASV
jgi:hypothetical protein